MKWRRPAPPRHGRASHDSQRLNLQDPCPILNPKGSLEPVLPLKSRTLREQSPLSCRVGMPSTFASSCVRKHLSARCSRGKSMMGASCKAWDSVHARLASLRAYYRNSWSSKALQCCKVDKEGTGLELIVKEESHTSIMTEPAPWHEGI